MKKRNRYPGFFNLFLILAAAAGLFLLLQKKSGFEVLPAKKDEQAQNEQFLKQSEEAGEKSPISGLYCPDASRRPMAVMLSGDAQARPLSGLAEADLVFNMEVITGSITRLMAVYVCGNPKEIGSIRSARHDYITLARGLDAIYAHWGGSHFALDKLKAGIIDNIDALPNPYNAFYRKSGVASPHNGFTSLSRLFNAAEKLGYRLENKFNGYPHLPGSQNNSSSGKAIIIDYGGGFDVKYNYDPSANVYLRWRSGKKEIDKNSGQQIAAKNVVIMRAPSRQIEGDYNDVQVEGEGRATVYRNGEEISGTWKKNAKEQTSKLFFYDEKGAEIKFVPGQIWVEIVELGQSVVWQ